MTDPFHKWIATVALIFSFAWGGSAYYVNTQISLTELKLTTRIVTLEHQTRAQEVTLRELKDLRSDINALRIELVKQGHADEE